jgi:hypothetical protein
MRWGLVELHVDLSGLTALGPTDAVIAGIRRDAQRPDAVRAAVEHARRLGCGFVLLPGWTVVAGEPPAWLLGLSAGVTVVAECLLPEAPARRTAGRVKGERGQPTGEGAPADDEDAPGLPWRGFVLRDGQVVVGPARQHVAGAAELWAGDALSEPGRALVRDLQARGPEGRRWSVPEIGEAMLLMCGEANLVAGGGLSACWHYEAVAEAGLTEEALKEIRVVANPAHTRSGPQALRDKRAWLSRGGVLIHTANTYSGGWSQGGSEDVAARRSSHAAACAWVAGELADLEVRWPRLLVQVV